MATARPPRPLRPVDYPSGDGKPLAETPLHRDNLLGLIEQLRIHYAGDRSVYISGNMFLYYVPGQLRKHVSPDVFVSLGVGDREREVYLAWEEGKGPDLVVEMTSKSTRREDLETKFRLYRDILKVREYVLFDPKGEYLDPPLRGYRLDGGEYLPIELVDSRLPSVVLGLHFERVGQVLRMYDPATGRLVPTPHELVDAAQAGARQAEDNLRRAEDEARQAELEARRAEAERQAAQDEARRAEAERQAAQDEARRAEAERQAAAERAERAEAAERELRAEVERLRRRADDSEGGPGA